MVGLLVNLVMMLVQLQNHQQQVWKLPRPGRGEAGEAPPPEDVGLTSNDFILWEDEQDGEPTRQLQQDETLHLC